VKKEFHGWDKSFSGNRGLRKFPPFWIRGCQKLWHWWRTRSKYYENNL